MLIDAAQREKLTDYLAEAYRWNPRVNLTAVPETDAWNRHIEESLKLLTAASPAPGARVVDIGSGMGVPGIPMAVLRPDLELCLLESDARKAGFLIHVAGLLGLGNVTVRAERAETVGHDAAARESFDLAVSRATAPAAVLCELALPLLRIGGHLAALVSSACDAVEACRRAAHLCGGGDPQSVSDGMLMVTKLKATPGQYPRRVGAPSRYPL